MRKTLLKPLKAETPERTKPKYEDVGEAITLNLEEDSSTSLVFSASKDVNKVGSSPHLDVRTWIESERYSGPTKKGVNFDVINAPEVIVAMVMKYLDCPEARLEKIIDAINENVLEDKDYKMELVTK